MSRRNEQCNKVCRILDDVLANRPTERDALIVAVRVAFRTAFRTAFDDLKECKTGRWIPCSERLPQPNEEDADGFIKAYLVQDGRRMDVARWNGDCWIAWGYGTALTNVTAWMPLPEPYKEEVR